MKQARRGGPSDTGGTSVGMTAARARVLDRLRSRPEAWGIPELAEYLDLHPNTVREHLTALTETGLAEYSEVRSPGPGRPARHYRATALGSGIDYLEMSIAMAEAISDLPNADELIQAAGEAWGERLAAQLRAAQSGQDLMEWLTGLGFTPQRRADGVIELRTCPVLAAARRSPHVVCGIHTGLMRALTRPVAGQVQVELQPWGSPTGCLIRLRAAEAADSVGSQVAR